MHCSVEKDGVETSSKLPPFQSDVEQMSQSSPPPGTIICKYVSTGGKFTVYCGVSFV